MTRLYIDATLRCGEELVLPPTTAHHVRTVLRLGADAEVTLFDGRGAVHGAHLTLVARDAVKALIGPALQTQTESALRVTLVQSISRGERMEFTLQKAVELGVHRIIPVTSLRTVVRLDSRRQNKRAQHWRGVIQHACEQSGRTLLPALDPILGLAEWHAARAPGACYVLHPHDATPLAREPYPDTDVTLVAGPEGGFDAREIAMLKAGGATAVELGPRILRTETAALCALAVMQALWGDLA
jgi:16S rRNA (uracil1498-N3)-methyltransferase